jgi:voltage-gated potassium channel
MLQLKISPRLQSWQNKTDGLLVVIAVGSLPLLLLETISDRLPDGDRNFIVIVNIVVFTAFAIDYIVKLVLSDSKPTYIRTQWLSFFIVISQLLALLPALGVLGVLRGVRAIRVLGVIARVIGIGAATKSSGKEFFKKRAASVAFGVAGLTLITSAVAFTIAEDVGDGRRIHSFFDALWWSAATITTVGYGDIYPVTAAGRIIAVFTMVVGISTLAVVTARIAKFLISTEA